MKTKLLKKVRRRYVILEISRHGKNDFEYINTSDLTHPFYVIVDSDSMMYYLGATQTYKKAFERLIKTVLIDYKNKSRRKLVATKVYYNEKKKS